MDKKDWRNFVLINPIDIIFRDNKEGYGPDGKAFSHIDLLNRSNDCIIFKIKTTDPQSYLVKPN